MQAKLIQEKSMIGRLQNELVRVNSEMGELDGQLERTKRAEAEAKRLQKRVTELEGASKGTDAGLASAYSKACYSYLHAARPCMCGVVMNLSPRHRVWMRWFWNHSCTGPERMAH
jgi:hypothetical protein